MYIRDTHYQWQTRSRFTAARLLLATDRAYRQYISGAADGYLLATAAAGENNVAPKDLRRLLKVFGLCTGRKASTLLNCSRTWCVWFHAHAQGGIWAGGGGVVF